MLTYHATHYTGWSYDLTARQEPIVTVEIKVPADPGTFGTNDYSKDYRYEINGQGTIYLAGVIKFANRRHPCYWTIDHNHRVPYTKSVVSDMLKRTVKPDVRRFLVQGVLMLRDGLIRMHGKRDFKKWMGRNKIDGKQFRVDLSRFQKPGVDPRVKKLVHDVSQSDDLH